MTQRIIFKEYQEKTIQEINENFNNESFSKCSTELNNSKITIEDLEKIKKYLSGKLQRLLQLQCQHCQWLAG